MSKWNKWLSNDTFAAIFGEEEFNLNYKKFWDKDTVLIAIFDPDKEHHPLEKTKGFSDTLQINFWDIEESFEGYPAITQDQGQIIKEYITKNINKKFLIHCVAGISRSAGVGCAVECIKNYNNNYEYKTGTSDIKNHYRYHPNWTVYDAIIKDTNGSI